jgi:hypothetical protein
VVVLTGIVDDQTPRGKPVHNTSAPIGIDPVDKQFSPLVPLKITWRTVGVEDFRYALTVDDG